MKGGSGCRLVVGTTPCKQHIPRAGHPVSPCSSGLGGPMPGCVLLPKSCVREGVKPAGTAGVQLIVILVGGKAAL